MAETITPTSFDLAVISLVETLSNQIDKIDPEVVRVRSKKDILDILDISQYHWSDICNHKRHITTKADKEQRIIGALVNKFNIDRRYIDRFPHYKTMFVRNIMAEEEAIYEVMPGSAKVLQRLLGNTREENAELKKEITKLKETISFQTDMLETQRQLIKTLQAKTNP